MFLDLASVKNAVVQTQKSMGGIDILICNAGISGPNEKLWDYPPEAWQKIMDINLTGVFNCLSAVTPLMIEKNYGRIVNVSSVAGKEGNPGAGPYSASKAGCYCFNQITWKRACRIMILLSTVSLLLLLKLKYSTK